MGNGPQRGANLESTLLTRGALTQPRDKARLVDIVRCELLERVGRGTIQRGRTDNLANRVKVTSRNGSNGRRKDSAGHVGRTVERGGCSGRVAYLFYDGRHANRQCVRANILRRHSTGAENRMIANADILEN